MALRKVAGLATTSKDKQTDIFAEDVGVSDDLKDRYAVRHVIQVRLAVAAKVTLQVNEGGAGTVVEYELNGGSALAANALKSEDFYLHGETTYNVHHEHGSAADIACEVFEEDPD